MGQGGGEGTGMSQTEDSVTNWRSWFQSGKREKKLKDCLSRQSFCLRISQKRRKAELLSKHIHTKTKLTNHITKTPWLLKPMDRRGMLIS